MLNDAGEVMTSKVFLLISLLLSTLTQSSELVFAQTASPLPAKIDEFGDINYEDTAARADNFAVVLQNNPGAQAYIIAYRGRDALPGVGTRYPRRIKNYLVKNRGIAPERVVTIDGGRHEASETKVEVWLVPAGASPPPPSSTIPAEQPSPHSPRKFDATRYYIPENDSDAYWSGYVEDQAAQLDGFAQALKLEPDSRGYMIAYAQYYVSRPPEAPFYDHTRGYFRTLIDPPGLIGKMLRRDRNYLSKVHGINPSRVVIVNGGYSEGRAIELWIVPPGASAPKPVPTAFPPKRRKR